MSIIDGAKNFDEAVQWVNFVLSAEAQSAGPEVGVYNVPSNMAASIPEAAPDVSTIKLIDYDFATYGSTDTRARLLKRWDEEIKP